MNMWEILIILSVILKEVTLAPPSPPIPVPPTQIVPSNVPASSAPTTPVPSTTGTPSSSLIPPIEAAKIKQGLIIYYAAMDSNSQMFFNTTLAALFDIFYPFIDFKFQPCQQASIIGGGLYCPNSADTQCYVDIVHACAAALIEDKQMLYKFLACTMKGTIALPDFSSCASCSNVDMTKIEACAKSSTGIMLCQDKIKNKIETCPTIPCFIFTDEETALKDNFNAADNTACLSNVQGALCAKLRTQELNKLSLLPNNCSTINVDIFYKVLDEGTQNFFKSLAAIFDQFSNSFYFQYIPCMYAEFVNNELQCSEEQDKSCAAGVVHSCAAVIIGPSNPIGLFKFVACTTADAKVQPDFEKCATDNNIDFAAINQCIDSGRGKYLCFENSKKRFSDTIPNLIFDLKYREEQSALAVNNIQLALCQELRSYNMTYPDVCKGSMKLSIFFNTMNLEFQYWARTTLMEIYKVFSSFIVFEFVPCRGVQPDQADIKCTSIVDPKCYTDKFVACAVNQVKDNTILLAELLSCLTQDYSGGLPPYDQCATAAQLDPAALAQCANGPDGAKFCSDNLPRQPDSVLSIAFLINDAFNEPVSSSIQRDYMTELCGQLSGLQLSYPIQCYDIPPPPPPPSGQP